MTGFDSSELTVNHAHDIFSEGFRAFGAYLRPDRTPKSEIDGLHSVGIKVWSIWEKGNPTSVDYFTSTQASYDAGMATSYAKVLGMPLGQEIFYCVDFDATVNDLDAITAYFKEVQISTKAVGYLCSVYGSGMVIEHLYRLGVIHSGMLAQSTGWAGYESEAPWVSIIQGKTTTVCGLNVDLDSVVRQNVLW